MQSETSLYCPKTWFLNWVKIFHKALETNKKNGIEYKKSTIFLNSSILHEIKIKWTSIFFKQDIRAVANLFEVEKPNV